MISALALAAASAATLPPQAQAQLRTVEQAVSRYRDFEVARREGWKKFGGDAPLMGEHWHLPLERGGVDYQAGQRIDFRRPSNLMYAWIGSKRVLTGVSFNVRLAPGEPVPEGFAGSADEWHVHDFPKAVAAALQDRPFLRWVANSFGPQHFVGKGDGRGRLAMVHVWTGPIPNPDGPFAHRNRAIPYAKLGLPLSFATGASEAAARGLMLASDKGCAETIDGALWIANASGRVKNQLHAVCRQAATHVLQGVRTGQKVTVNTMAEHGWAMFDSAWKRLLTREQQARIAAMTEHGPSEGEAPHGSHHHGH